MPRNQVANFQENLRALCTGYGAVTALAEHLGIHRVTMSRIVNGHEGLTMEQAVETAKFYDLDLSDMLVSPKEFRKILATT